jgi:hypothetical protein
VESHTRALAWPGLGWAHDMRVNGPPKSAPHLAGCSYLLPFGFLAVTFILTDRYKISTDREIFVGG